MGVELNSSPAQQEGVGEGKTPEGRNTLRSYANLCCDFSSPGPSRKRAGNIIVVFIQLSDFNSLYLQCPERA